MVYYFKSLDGHTLYMGKDKFENELLIRYGFPEDVWFHVEDLSSAHVYLRLRDDETIETIPEDLLEQCAQLTKLNSIEGSKKEHVKIVYTMWRNLEKRPSMEVGQVDFKDREQAHHLHNISKNTEILKKIMKTKEELYPDLESLQMKRLKEEEDQKKEHFKKMKIEELKKKEAERMEREKYNDFLATDNYKSNKDQDDDDFM